MIELCQGGCLQSLLNEPENAFGLAENEFLLVFKHVGRFYCYKMWLNHTQFYLHHIALINSAV